MFKKIWNKIWCFFNDYNYHRLELEVYLYRSTFGWRHSGPKPDWLLRSEIWMQDI